MAKKVALINMKGGVGKSTLTVNLAWYFALPDDGKRVLVVDLDPQFNASQYLLGPSEYLRVLQSGRRTIWDVFEQRTRHPEASAGSLSAQDVLHNRVTIPRGGGRIDVILSRLELAFSLKTPYHQKEQELARLLAQIESEYDLILIDCAPTESLLTTAAYLASDFLLVPVKPEYLSTIGLPLLVQSMRDFAQSYPNHALQLAGVVFNATTEYAPEEMLAKDDVRTIAQQPQWYVFDSEVPYSRSFPKSARLGVSIFSTPHTRRMRRILFAAFAIEFARRIGL
jgi:chromosome partitioning protein